MIHLTAEVLCDSCGKVCGVGEPHASTEFAFASSAIYEAERKARAHGAHIGMNGVKCCDCWNVATSRALNGQLQIHPT